MGGAVAQYQYSQPAGPPEPGTTEQSLQPSTPGYSSSPTGTSTGAIDCNTLMTNHQQMMQELDAYDKEVDTRLSQMKDAKSDKAKLDATAGVVELMATQRKQIRDRMMAMEHQTLQFMLTNKSQDLATACPQLTQQLQHGSMPGHPTTPGTTEQGGPNDLELGNEQNSGSTTTSPSDDSNGKQNNPNR